MIAVSFHRRAQRALRNIPKDRAEQIVEAIERLANLDDPTIDGHVTIMRGDLKGRWRLRVGDYRVIFQLESEPDTGIIVLLFVTDLGTRGGIYN